MEHGSAFRIQVLLKSLGEDRLDVNIAGRYSLNLISNVLIHPPIIVTTVTQFIDTY